MTIIFQDDKQPVRIVDTTDFQVFLIEPIKRNGTSGYVIVASSLTPRAPQIELAAYRKLEDASGTLQRIYESRKEGVRELLIPVRYSRESGEIFGTGEPEEKEEESGGLMFDDPRAARKQDEENDKEVTLDLSAPEAGTGGVKEAVKEPEAPLEQPDEGLDADEDAPEFNIDIPDAVNDEGDEGSEDDPLSDLAIVKPEGNSEIKKDVISDEAGKSEIVDPNTEQKGQEDVYLPF